jgi:hypothetical protein
MDTSTRILAAYDYQSGNELNLAVFTNAGALIYKYKL